jgi:FkbM family methyltransferase
MIAARDLLPSLWARITGSKKRTRRAAEAAFDAAISALHPGDLAIDLGANVGLFTARMAATGADVVAFEPDPHAFALLSDRVKHLPNVTLIAAAAGDAPGTLTLFRHVDFAEHPDLRTTSSSIIPGKTRMDEGAGIAVDVIDFAAWLAEKNRPVALLKIDIEGAEVALLERLLATPQATLVTQAFVETHERIIPHLRQRTAALKALMASRVAAGQTRPAINWDWQ